MDEKLLVALDNNDNEGIFNLTTNKIKEMNANIVNELHLDKILTQKYLNKLINYRYVDEIHEIKYGAFVKWIPISEPTNLPLKYGIVCDIKITDDGVIIICKNFVNKYYTFKMNECLIFQKLSSQEEIIIHALDNL